MTTGFHYFTLEEVYDYAESLGYTREDVEITEDLGYDYDTDTQFRLGYYVGFGHEYTETWTWYFEDLDQPSVEYDHDVEED